MFYVVKNENEIVAAFQTMIDARAFIENKTNFTDLGDYAYVIGTDLYEIMIE